MEDRVNDFVIKIANVNGTGSASANSLIMKAIFRMGIPVVGKNFFPSNIQGLPTWYEVRVSEAGYCARREGVDIMVAMNPQTYAEDLAELVPGGTLIFDSTWPRRWERDDITTIAIPIAQMCAEAYSDARHSALKASTADRQGRSETPARAARPQSSAVYRGRGPSLSKSARRAGRISRSDHPVSSSTALANSKRVAEELFGHLDPTAVEKIARGNAIDLFGLERGPWQTEDAVDA